MTRTLSIVAALGLSAVALTACGGGGDDSESLASVRAQIAKAQQEQALCAEMIETETINIETAEELGEPTHNFELLLATNEKCLEEEQLKEVDLREQEGELEEDEIGNLSDEEYDERQAKCERESLAETRRFSASPAEAEQECLEWRKEDEELGE